LATFQQVLAIGTTPVKVLSFNLNRNAWRVTMLSVTLAAGNTGRVHVGRNFAPNSTVGDPNSGDALLQAGEVKETRVFKDDTIFLGDLWLVASASNQQVSVEEVTKDAA
jgi:hypothetical protein